MKKLLLLCLVLSMSLHCFGNFVRIIIPNPNATEYRVYYGSDIDAKTNIVILPIHQLHGTTLTWDSVTCDAPPVPMSDYSYLLVENWPDNVPFYYAVEHTYFRADMGHAFISVCPFYPPKRNSTIITPTIINIRKENP